MDSRSQTLEIIALESQRGLYKRKSDDEMHCRGLYDTPSSRHAKLGYASLMQFDFENYLRAVNRRPLVIADIGCGMGKFLYDIKQIDDSIEVFGIDSFLYDGCLDSSYYIIGKMPNEDYMSDFMDSLPESVFDIVTSANCLEPLDVEIGIAQIRQINRVVSNDGFAKIQIPNCFWDKKVFHIALGEGIRMTHAKVKHSDKSSSRIITIMGKNWEYPQTETPS